MPSPRPLSEMPCERWACAARADGTDGIAVSECDIVERSSKESDLADLTPRQRGRARACCRRGSGPMEPASRRPAPAVPGRLVWTGRARSRERLQPDAAVGDAAALTYFDLQTLATARRNSRYRKSQRRDRSDVMHGSRRRVCFRGPDERRSDREVRRWRAASAFSAGSSQPGRPDAGGRVGRKWPPSCFETSAADRHSPSTSDRNDQLQVADRARNAVGTIFEPPRRDFLPESRGGGSARRRTVARVARTPSHARGAVPEDFRPAGCGTIARAARRCTTRGGVLGGRGGAQQVIIRARADGSRRPSPTAGRCSTRYSKAAARRRLAA